MEAHKASRPTKHRVVMTTKAIPTATHMMFVKLFQEGTVKAVISQNTDGLHRRSGLPANGKVKKKYYIGNIEKLAESGLETIRLVQWAHDVIPLHRSLRAPWKQHRGEVYQVQARVPA